jgi:selenocysteine lyase/cysteine desulfurase
MLTCKAAKFSLPEKVTYLNCAYMSPMLKSVEKVGVRSVRLKRNPVGIAPQDFFTQSDALRQEFAKLVNVSEPRRIVIIPSASYGLASVAKNLNITKGQHIIVAAEQFPSNYYSWEALCKETGAQIKAIAPEKCLSGRGKKWNEKILESINTKTRAVAIAHTHWADGTKFDLQAIRKRTQDVGALLIIDGTQSVGALPFDVQQIKPDALICAGYKWLLGPYSIGLAYYGEYFDNGKPIEENWINRLNSEDFSALVTYEPAYQEGALRYEVGEHSNFILLPMLLNAIATLNKWHVENVQAYCSAISESMIRNLRENGFWIEDAESRGGHLFGIRLPDGTDVNKIKNALVKNNIYVSFRGDAIRVSPNVYNHERDMQKFAKVLSSNVK